MTELACSCAQVAEAMQTTMPLLLQHLEATPDFYGDAVDFASWVPLAARFCPGDTYKYAAAPRAPPPRPAA